ncbi:Poly [ADP-ribose] polymerase tankyrase-1 [Linum grandiflorum]
MAVHRDDLMDEEENEEDNVLFQDGNVVDLDQNLPEPLLSILSAAQSGNAEALTHALDNFDGNIDVPLEDGDTALHLVCLYGHFSCAQILLEKGANVEVKDEDGAIPLHDACAGGYTEIVQLLLSHANSPDSVKRMLETVDDEGDTPLHHAARGEHKEIVNLLLASGASVTRTNSYGKTPSELAEPGTEVRTILEATASSN